jgi:hypothetical protein
MNSRCFGIAPRTQAASRLKRQGFRALNRLKEWGRLSVRQSDDKRPDIN